MGFTKHSSRISLNNCFPSPFGQRSSCHKAKLSHRSLHTRSQLEASQDSLRLTSWNNWSKRIIFQKCFASQVYLTLPGRLDLWSTEEVTVQAFSDQKQIERLDLYSCASYLSGLRSATALDGWKSYIWWHTSEWLTEGCVIDKCNE